MAVFEGIRRDMAAITVRVAGHEVRKTPRQTYAAYELNVVSESGTEYTLWKRWNDLKLTEEALRKACGASYPRDLPKFEAHSWRMGTAALDDAFLNERAIMMQELLQAWLDAFETTSGQHVRLEEDPPCGPEPLLAFLDSTEAEPSELMTPRGAPPSRDCAGASSDELGASGVCLLGSASCGAAATDAATAVEGATEATAEAEQPTQQAVATDTPVIESAGAQAAPPTACDGEASDAPRDDAKAVPPPATAAATAAVERASEKTACEGGALPPLNGGFRPPAVTMSAASGGGGGDKGGGGGLAMMLLWGSLVLLPVIAVLAKEVFGVGGGVAAGRAVPDQWPTDTMLGQTPEAALGAAAAQALDTAAESMGGGAAAAVGAAGASMGASMGGT